MKKNYETPVVDVITLDKVEITTASVDVDFEDWLNGGNLDA